VGGGGEDAGLGEEKALPGNGPLRGMSPTRYRSCQLAITPNRHFSEQVAWPPYPGIRGEPTPHSGGFAAIVPPGVHDSKSRLSSINIGPERKILTFKFTRAEERVNLFLLPSAGEVQ